MLKRALGGLAGLVAGVVVIMIVQAVGHKVYPPPPGFDPSNAEALKALMASMPVGALLFVLLSYALGAFGGGLIAARIGKHLVPALVVGGLLTVASIMNLTMVPHPTWFAVANLLLVLPLAFAGGKLGAPAQA
jgi:hypothetical protein